MLKQISWPKTWPPVEPHWNMYRLARLVELAFDGRTKIAQDFQATELLKKGVVTLTDGIETETHTLETLIYRTLPYILFSNNRWYVNAWRKMAVYSDKPVDSLYHMVARYYLKVKNINI